MKSSLHHTILNFTLALLIFCAVPCVADNNTTSSHVKDEQGAGFLKLGVGFKSRSSPYSQEKNGYATFIDGRYQWQNGVYVEYSNGKNELNQDENGGAELNQGLSFGYNFYNTEHWNFDLNISQAHGKLGLGFIDDVNSERSFFIRTKMTDMLGLRATGNYSQTRVQFIVAPYSFNSEYDDGLYASLWLAQSWQIKNWEVYASLGAQYRSEEIISYYYELPEARSKTGFADYNTAVNNFDHYHASAAVNLTMQVGLSYPISENWLFESFIKYSNVSDSITDSPVMFLLVTSEGKFSKHISEAGLLFSYVF